MWYVIRKDELYHHGILGQKWGKCNGPPYPLDASDHSSSEKKAGWRRSLDSDGEGSYNKNQKKASNKTSSKRKGLSDKQKKALKIGAAVTATALVAVGGYALYKSGKLNNLLPVSKGQEAVGDILGVVTENSKPTGNPKIKALADELGLHYDPSFVFSKDTIEQCVAGINPKDKNGVINHENCGGCATAVLLRTLGITDAKASANIPQSMRNVRPDGSLGNAFDPKKLISAFVGAEEESLDGNFLGKKDACNKIQQKLLGYGEGASGYIWTTRQSHNRSGHYTVWKVLDGVVHIMEGQDNQAHDGKGFVQSGELVNSMVANFDFNSTSWARLDDKEIVPSVVKTILGL